MRCSEHTHRLLRNAEDVIDRYLKGEVSEEFIQNSIEAIGSAFDNSTNSDIREAFAYFPEKVEEIIFMEFPMNKRKLVEIEALKLRGVIRKYGVDSTQ